MILKNSSDFHPWGKFPWKSLGSFFPVTLKVSGDLLMWKCILCSWRGIIQSKAGAKWTSCRSLFPTVIPQNLPVRCKVGALRTPGSPHRSPGNHVLSFTACTIRWGLLVLGGPFLLLLSLPSLPTVVPCRKNRTLQVLGSCCSGAVTRPTAEWALPRGGCSKWEFLRNSGITSL